MADGTIRIGTKIDFSGVKADVKALEKELATVQKEADKLNKREKDVTDRYNTEREFDKQFPEEFSHREQIDKKYAEQLEPIIKDRETLNQKMQEYNALLEQANAKLQQQSAIAQAGKELSGGIKTAGMLDKIQTEEQYQSLLEKTRAQMARIEALAGDIAQKHGLSKDQVLSTNAEYKRLSDQMAMLKKKSGDFKKSNKKDMKEAEKSAKSFGNSIKDTIKQFGKMALAVFGIRSAFNAIRKATNAYLESNAELKNQLESLWNVAGQAIGPFVEKMVKGISTIVSWVASLVKALTGIDIIAKANAAAMKKQAAATKAATASLAGFDEMNKLSDAGGGASANTGLFDTSYAAATPQWFENLKTKIQEGDWFGGGKTLGERLMQWIEEIDIVAVGEKLGGIIGKIIAFALGFATGTDPTTMNGGINGFVGGLLTGLSEELGKVDWVDFGKTLLEFILLGFATSTPGGALLSILLSPNSDDLMEGVSSFVGTILGALYAVIKGLGERFGEIASSIWGGIKGWFDEHIDWEGTPGEIIAGLWEGIKEAIKNVGTWVKTHIWEPFINAFKKSADINSPSGEMKKQGGFLMDGLKEGIKARIEKIKQAAADVWEAIKEKFASVGNWFKEIFTDAWEKVKEVFSKGGEIWKGIKEGVSDTFKNIVNKLIGGINTILSKTFGKINSMLNKIRSVTILGVQPFINWWSYDPINVPQIPLLAKGGIVNNPGRGVPAIIGEAGAEAVLPLENNTEWMDILADKIGGNVTIPIYMDGKKIATYVVDIQKKKAFAMNGA